MKGLCVDPCEADTLRAVYIVLPSFQPSPETTIALGGDDTSIDFTGVTLKKLAKLRMYRNMHVVII